MANVNFTSAAILDTAKVYETSGNTSAILASAANVLYALTLNQFIEDKAKRTHTDFIYEAIHNAMGDAGASNSGAAQYAKNAIAAAAKLSKFWGERVALAGQCDTPELGAAHIRAILNDAGVKTNQHLTVWLKDKSNGGFAPEAFKAHVTATKLEKADLAVEKAVEAAGKIRSDAMATAMAQAETARLADELAKAKAAPVDVTAMSDDDLKALAKAIVAEQASRKAKAKGTTVHALADMAIAA